MTEDAGKIKQHATTRHNPWVFLAAAVQAACAADEALPSSFPFATDAGDIVEFSEAFEVVDTLVLEERDDVINANPSVTFDGEHFVMSDLYSIQARVYATSGKLLWAGGRSGSGPGEFTDPVAARRNREGRIVVMDLQSRTVSFDPAGGTDPVTAQIPFLVTDQWDMDGRRKLVVGDLLPGLPDGSRPLLHIWNPESQEVEKSFFDVTYPDHVAPWSMAAFADATVARDTIWAMSSLSDSIYMFALDGSAIASIPLPLSRQVDTDDRDLLWRAAVFWFLDNGDIAVRVQALEMATRSYTYYMVIVDRGGHARALVANTPKLFIVAEDLFYFQNPAHLEANQWIVARIRSGP